MTTTHLNGHHRKTLASILRHPASHNVEWHDVVSLLGHLGSVSERHGGGHDISIGVHRMMFAPPHGKDLSSDDLRDLRAFLVRTGMAPPAVADDADEVPSPPAPTPAPEAVAGPHCIVLIDHHQARLFGLGGATADPTVPLVVKPDDADGSARRIEHRQGNADHDGGHAQEDDEYYGRVSANLKAAHRIVLFSDGKGRSNAGAHLVDYLERHHPGIADRIIANQRVDIAHLSDGEIAHAGAALLAAA